MIESSDLKLRICIVILKCPAANEKEKDILKILNSKATLHKHPIYTLESSKHPLNLVRLSL
jgi:hypothetical protein